MIHPKLNSSSKIKIIRVYSIHGCKNLECYVIKVYLFLFQNYIVPLNRLTRFETSAIKLNLIEINI